MHVSIWYRYSIGGSDISCGADSIYSVSGSVSGYWDADESDE